jgi:4-diphosphocytidyl-2-C-methyl-D-erythritol kinase
LGAGEQIYRYRPLAEHAYVVLPSREQLSTPAVFREADRLGLPRGDLAECEQRVRAALRPGARLPAELIVNDLQPAALSLCPSIADALEAVSAAGAEHALVSGSGPTVVGLRWGPDAEAWAQETAASLEPRFPGALAAQPLTTP